MALGEYLLARSNDEATRLEKQHAIWMRTCGYHIHPSLAATLPTAPRIADVATGTGIWIREVATQYPDAQCDGFDISPLQYPAQDKLSPRIKLHVHDARQPFPAEFQGQYDLVHIRGIIAGLNTSEWDNVVNNLVQLLKPNGALQWAEGDLARTQLLRNNAWGATFQHLPALMQAWMANLSQRDLSGPLRLPELLGNAGMDVVVDIVATDRLLEFRDLVTRNYIQAILASGWATDKKNLFTSNLNQLEANLLKEVDAGAYLRTDNHTIVARRKTSNNTH